MKKHKFIDDEDKHNKILFELGILDDLEDYELYQIMEEFMIEEYENYDYYKKEILAEEKNIEKWEKENWKGD